jgi:hypothetical protein
MDNHEENENDLNKNKNPEDTPPNADIPLWLQGIEETTPEETKPIRSENDSEGAWIREIDNNNDEIADDPTEHDRDSEVNFEGLNDAQLAQSEVSEDYELELNDIEDMESTEEIEIQAFSEDLVPNGMESDFDTLSSAEGYVDISQIGITEQSFETIDNFEDEPLREGELPDWLQEMIAESEQQPEEGLSPIEETPEDFEETQIERLIDEKEFSTEEAHRHRDEAEFLDEISESVIEFDYDTTIAEEDTAPISVKDELETALSTGDLPEVEEAFPVDEVELTDSQRSYETELEEIEDLAVEKADIIQTDQLDDAEFVNVETADISDAPPDEAGRDTQAELAWSTGEEPTSDSENSFDRIKHFFDDGQIEPALPIIKDMVADEEQLEELEVLLKELTQQEPSVNSKVMETLGDIALKQNKPQDALQSYAKALKFLLESDEAQDEIN